MPTNPYLKKSESGSTVITPAGHEFLSGIVSDPDGSVYVFKDAASPLMVAAAMARLSRRADDLRIVYLDEFANIESGADDLIHRVVTAFGDDSVQQLMPLQLVVEQASNLLTKRLEWGRLAAYLEQSTRYIYFDQPGPDGRFRYFVPTNINGLMYQTYCSTMDSIFNLYSTMVRGTTDFVRRRVPEPADPKERAPWLGATRAQACDAIRPVLPAATTSTVGIVGSAQAVESLILHLASDPLQESRDIGLKILKEVRKVAPVFFERADLPERGGAMVAYRMANREVMRTLAGELTLKERIPPKPVTLVDYWPRFETQLVPAMLFSEAGGMTLREIETAVDERDIPMMVKIFQAYIGERFNRRHKPGRAMELMHYEWQILGDYGTFRDLQRHRIVDAFEWPRLTTQYGFDVPDLVVEAGFSETFKQCFRIAEDLNGEMIRQGYGEEAQYATLLGHKMLYHFVINAREAFHIHELRTSPQGHPGYRKIVQMMHEEMRKVHPLIAEAMKFVNMGEDPELTRLAGEMATQRKLELLEKKKE